MISSDFQQVYFNNELYLMNQIPSSSVIDNDMANFIMLNNDMFIAYGLINERPDVLYYKINNHMSLGEQMTQTMDKKKVLVSFDNILQAMESLKNKGIPFANVMWNWNYIYIDSDTGQLKFILLPVDMHFSNEYGEILNLIRNMLVTIKYDLIENCHYVAQLITTINEYAAPGNVIDDFARVVKEQLNDTVMKRKTEKSKQINNGNVDNSSSFNIAKDSWESLLNGDMNPADDQTDNNRKPIACLVRMKTGENIQIVGDVFKIGKDPAVADYAISDNKAVSGLHAKIYNKRGVHYIEDNNSTNKTYVNGKKLESNEQMLLIKGMVINMAGEEFQFNII